MKSLLVNAGDRVAQVIIEKITETEVIEVEDLNATERGNGGFGSTGVKKLEGENKSPYENLSKKTWNIFKNIMVFLKKREKWIIWQISRILAMKP